MLMTANPHADAERHENAMDYKEREREYEAQQLAEQEARSADFFTRALSCDASDWYSETVKTTAKGALMSPDELLAEATWREVIHKVPRHLLAKLLTSDAAAEVRAQAGIVLGKQFPEAGDLNA